VFAPKPYTPAVSGTAYLCRLQAQQECAALRRFSQIAVIISEILVKVLPVLPDIPLHRQNIGVSVGIMIEGAGTTAGTTPRHPRADSSGLRASFATG